MYESDNRNGLNRLDFKNGFTLLDTLMVLLILGIVGMAIMPQFYGLVSEAKLNGAATELVTALEYAESLAVRYQKPFDVRAYRYDYSDPKANQFVLRDVQYIADAGIHLDAIPPVYTYGSVFNPLDKKPYVIDFNDIQAALVGVITPKQQYEGVDIVSVPGGGSDGLVRFYPDGHCSDPAGPANTYVLSYAGSQKTITVEGATGRITVQ